MCSTQPFKWHKTDQRCLPEWYKPSPPPPPPRPECKHELPLRKDVGGGVRLPSQVKVEAVVSYRAAPPKKREKLWLNAVPGHGINLRAVKLVLSTLPTLINWHLPATTGFTHTLWRDQTAKWTEARGGRKSSRWRLRYSEGGCFGSLSTKDKKWSLALGMKKDKSQSWGEKNFLF